MENKNTNSKVKRGEIYLYDFLSFCIICFVVS